MLYRFFNKCLVFGTILLFLSGGLGFPCDPPSTGPVCVNMNTLDIFTSIQSAIDDPATLNGHTIWVVSNKCIHERITVNKSITIMGEPNVHYPCPIIDGQCGGDVITITADGVTIENLIIENRNADDLPFSCGPLYAGILVLSNNNIIRRNEFRRCPKGIYLYSGSSGNEIYENKITCNIQNYTGIMLAGSSNNTIYSNKIIRESTLGDGMSLTQSSNNTIIANTFDNHAYGIILFLYSNNNIIHHNNFLDSIYYNAVIENSLGACTGNQWDNGSSSGGNYWSDHTCVDSNNNGICDDPYLIPFGLGDQDNYPLAAPFEPMCGNVNGSPQPNPASRIDIIDIVYLINYIYNNGPLPIPLCAGDVNGDGEIDDDDINYLVDFVFRMGPAPVPGCCDCCHCFVL